jgi:GWxTD domain-containing protein
MERVSASWVNMYTSKQELYEYVQGLRPISGANDLFALDNTFSDVSTAELPHLQQYFYAFWQERNPEDSEAAWLQYREKLAFVEQEFGTRNKRGYNTDRGRIWLQYGAPDDITDRPNEPSSYPYQIWRYYKAGQWNNVRFVFYDTTLLAEDYELLHSDNIPGELKNPQWQLLLEQRNTPMNNVDMQQGREHLGGRVDMLFENPR